MQPLVGRKKELYEVLRLFTVDGAQLVTVTGPRGIGKTRFALAVVEELRALGGEVALADDAARAPVERPALATRREPFGVADEDAYALRRLAEAPAVELFRQRAPSLHADYGELAAACRRLGGVPLAIVRAAELAGARPLEEAVESALRDLD